MILSVRCQCENCGKIQEIDKLVKEPRFYKKGDIKTITWKCGNCEENNGLTIHF